MRSKAKIQKSEGIWDQLMELRAITEVTGTIHEGQIQQMKLWAPLALPHAEDIKIAVGLPHLDVNDKVVDLHKVEYRATATKKPPQNLKKRLEGLDRSVKALLGDYFEVVCKINSKTIFCRKGSARKPETLKSISERLKKNGK